MEPSNPSVAVIVLATTVSFFAAPAASSYRHRSIDVDGVEAHYIEAGEGAPFILIHGGLAWSSGEANYAEVMAPLGEHFRVIAPDVIGFGRTTPRGARDYSGEAQGDFLIGFIEALDVGPVFLQGNSHGGFLAQYIAHKRPDLVRRLVITNSLNGTVPIPSLPEGKSFIYAPGGHQYASMTKDDVRTMLQSYYQHRALVTERRVEARVRQLPAELGIRPRARHRRVVFGGRTESKFELPRQTYFGARERSPNAGPPHVERARLEDRVGTFAFRCRPRSRDAIFFPGPAIIYSPIRVAAGCKWSPTG